MEQHRSVDVSEAEPAVIALMRRAILVLQERRRLPSCGSSSMIAYASGRGTDAGLQKPACGSNPKPHSYLIRCREGRSSQEPGVVGRDFTIINSLAGLTLGQQWRIRETAIASSGMQCAIHSCAVLRNVRASIHFRRLYCEAELCLVSVEGVDARGESTGSNCELSGH